MLYLLAVLLIAIRRGQLEALVTAVLCMLVLNYLFIAPRHQLTIAHRQDVVELGGAAHHRGGRRPPGGARA